MYIVHFCTAASESDCSTANIAGTSWSESQSVETKDRSDAKTTALNSERTKVPGEENRRSGHLFFKLGFSPHWEMQKLRKGFLTSWRTPRKRKAWSDAPVCLKMFLLLYIVSCFENEVTHMNWDEHKSPVRPILRPTSGFYFALELQSHSVILTPHFVGRHSFDFWQHQHLHTSNVWAVGPKNTRPLYLERTSASTSPWLGQRCWSGRIYSSTLKRDFILWSKVCVKRIWG